MTYELISDRVSCPPNGSRVGKGEHQGLSTRVTGNSWAMVSLCDICRTVVVNFKPSSHRNDCPRTRMKSNNLPLSVTLRDLALLRASDIDLSTVLEPSQDHSYEDSLERSLEFMKQARAAMKLVNNDNIEGLGARIDEIRTQCEDILSNLGTVSE